MLSEDFKKEVIYEENEENDGDFATEDGSQDDTSYKVGELCMTGKKFDHKSLVSNLRISGRSLVLPRSRLLWNLHTTMPGNGNQRRGRSGSL